MMDVTLYLFNPEELAIVQAAAQEILDRRQASRAPTAPVAPPVAAPVAGTSGPAMGTIPTAEQMEEAVKAYGTRNGFVQARALLDEYAPGKQIRAVPAEKRTELYVRLTA